VETTGAHAPRREELSISSAFPLGRMTVVDPLSQRRDGLLLDPPTGSTRPRSVISPVMATSPGWCVPVSAETSATAIVIPAEGPSLGVAPSGMWMWRSTSRWKWCEPQLARPSAGVGDRRHRGLLHDLSERAGQLDRAASGYHGDLDLEDLTPDDVQASPVAIPTGRRPSRGRPQVPGWAQQLAEVLHLDADRSPPGVRFGHPRASLRATLASQPVQLADSGLPGVRLHDPIHVVNPDLDSRRIEPVPTKLLRDEEAPGDGALLGIEVPGNPDDLHPIPQRVGDPGEGVRRGDEKHLGKVELELEVVVLEGLVLFGVEHLEKGRGGISVPVAGELVDLVQEEDGVAGASRRMPWRIRPGRLPT
jgi:hypothetical protein